MYHMYIYNYIYFWKKHRSKNATWHTWTLAACRVLVRRSYPLCSVVWRSQSWCGQLEEEHECRKVPDPQDVDTIKKYCNKGMDSWIKKSDFGRCFLQPHVCFLQPHVYVLQRSSKCIVTIRYLYYHILSYIIIYYHILSYIIIYYHILSYYPILSYIIIYSYHQLPI